MFSKGIKSIVHTLSTNYLFIIYSHKKKGKYNADMSLQKRKQEKNMVGPL
jgi:hypothetical protein